MSLQVWLPLNRDPNMTPEIASYRKESGVTLTEDTDGWYKVHDTTHSANGRWGIYYDFTVKPNTIYTLYVYSKSTTGTKASIGIQSFAVVTWPAVRDTNTASDEKLTTYSWTTGPSDSITRVYLALMTTSTKDNDYVFYKEPRVYEAPQNQGIVNVDITENGAIYQSNTGKLGGCFKTTSNTHIDLKYNGDQINTGSISFGGWFNFNKNELQERFSTYTYTDIRTTPTGNIIGNNSYGGVGLIWYTNNMYDTNGILNNLYITCSIRSTNNGARATSGREIPFNTWVHLFLIFNKITKELQLWINGELVQYSIMLDFDDARSQNLMLNYNAVWGGNGPSFNIPFLINDVRIYDHALSTQEIKELSRGLVLHYPLDNNGLGNENLLANTDFEGTSKKFTLASGTEGGFTFTPTAAITSSTKYTVSCRIRGNANMTLYRICTGGNEATSWMNRSDLSATDYKYFTITFTSPNSNKTLNSIYICTRYGTQNSQIGDWFEIEPNSLKLELGDEATSWCPNVSDTLYTKMGMNNNIVYDISGFNNNGTITGALSTSSDTVRYKVATYFNGSSSISAASLPNEVKTISLWINISEIPTTNSLVFIDTNSRLALGFYSSGTLFIVSSVDTAANVVAINNKITINKWHHIVVIKTGQQSRQVYIDGSLLSNASVSNNYYIHQGNNLMLGQRLYGSTTNYFTGKMSDFRAYATAFSTSDVQELYEMGQEVV